MSVLTRHAAPTHTVPGAHFTSLATPSSGSADTAVWEVRLSPGHAGAAHEVTRHEVFVITDGAGRITLDGTAVDVAAGDTVVVPPWTAFSLEAIGSRDLVATCILPADGQAIIDGGEPFTPPWAR